MARFIESFGSIPVALEAKYRLVLPAEEPPPAGFPVLLGLHGFGLDGGLLKETLAPLLPAPYALLLPDGPFPVEVRAKAGRRVGRSWYQYTGDQAAFLVALDFAIGHVERVLADAARRHPVDRDRVAVLGYSQGGYLAGFLALRNAPAYRGLVTISCRVKVEALGDALARVRDFPVLVIHGRRDRVVELAPQEESIRVLREHGAAVELLLHDGGHELPPEAVRGMDGFLRRIL